MGDWACSARVMSVHFDYIERCAHYESGKLDHWEVVIVDAEIFESEGWRPPTATWGSRKYSLGEFLFICGVFLLRS